MNRWAALLAGAAMTISAPAAAQEAIGDWQGTLDAGGQKLRLVFHVAQGPDGKLTGTIDSLDQGAFGIPLGDVVLESDRLTIAVPPPRTRSSRRRQEGPADPLFEALREERRRIASEAGVPPYVVFHDSTLREIAERKPRNLFELGEVQGIGTAKLERYGEAMLAVLATADA